MSQTWKIIITVIVTAVIVSGGIYLLKEIKLKNSESSTATDTNNQQKVLAVDPVTLQNAQSIATCGTNVEHQIPVKEIQQQFGIGPLLDNGYEMVDVCRDGNDRIAFILAKNELNLLFKETSTCQNACDRVAFGTIDMAKRESVVILSKHRLGIYAEAYDQFCKIDTIQANGLFGDTLYLYCGSGESGGYTHWYTFKFSDDNLTEVQRMTEIIPSEVFDVKDKELLKQFHFKSNAEME